MTETAGGPTPVPLPKVRLSSVLAGQVADMTGYVSDLTTARAFVDELVELRSAGKAGSIVATACWHSLALAYRRPFTTGRSFGPARGQRVRLPDEWIDSLDGRAIHDWLIKLANEHVAHQVDSRHQVLVFAVLQPRSEPGIDGILEVSVRALAEDRDPAPVGEYLDRMVKAASAELRLGESLLIKETQDRDLDELYAHAALADCPASSSEG